MDSVLENKLNNIREIFNAIDNIKNPEKKKLLIFKIIKDLDNLNNKFEYLYYKYYIKNKKINNLKNEYDKYISMSQNTINNFFPFMIYYNVLQLQSS